MSTAEDTRRRLLVFAYYFPPLGLSGVQRVAGFAKYLPEYGWDVSVITAKPAGYFAYDEGLRQEVEAAGAQVYATRSLDPTRLFGKKQAVALPAESNRHRFAKASQYLFVPDNKVGWIPFAVHTAQKLLRRQKHDVVLASAPPYSGLLVASRVAKRFSLPLVVDFRDDWLENPRHTYPRRMHWKVNRNLERRVLRAADCVTAINPVIRDSLARRGPSPASVHVLPHGHDITAQDRAAAVSRGDKMVVTYAGVFYHAQTPDYFLRALALVAKDRPDVAENLTARFVGLFPADSARLVNDLGLQAQVQCVGYVPHDEAVTKQLTSDVLWMTIGEQPGGHGITTSKLSEYVGCGKPILALVPEGAAQTDLERYRAVRIVPPKDVRGIASALVHFYEAWQQGMLPTPSSEFIASRSQRVTAGELAQILDKTVA